MPKWIPFRQNVEAIDSKIVRTFVFQMIFTLRKLSLFHWSPVELNHKHKLRTIVF